MSLPKTRFEKQWRYSSAQCHQGLTKLLVGQLLSLADKTTGGSASQDHRRHFEQLKKQAHKLGLADV